MLAMFVLKKEKEKMLTFSFVQLKKLLHPKRKSNEKEASAGGPLPLS